ncbi:MAG: polyketide synthase dehydratase domain-containing protein, partial [Anaerolineae bacterium]|nr:polyketide synthase dehydratase domain-containing protein [Anaerolineae bacterium]
MLAEFEQVAATITYHKPKLLLLSDVTGLPADNQVITTPAYWRDHVRASVRFYDAVQWLAAQHYKLFLEIGPSPTLSGMGMRCLPDGDHLWLPSMRQNKDNWQQILESLGTLYTQGIRINWQGFEQARHHHCVPLPTYPFFRQRYWLDVNKQPRPATASPGGHPLLGQRVQSPVMNDLIFESFVSTDTVPFLADHVIQNQVLLPSTAFLEMALSAANKAFPTKTTAVTDMLIQRGLVLSDDLCQIQTVISQADEEGAAFRIFSFAPDEATWHLHAEGQLSVTDGETAVSTPITLATLKERCTQEQTTLENYANLQQRGIQFGPSFQGVAHLWRGENEALGHIEQPQAIVDAERYIVHPALLDSGLQMLITAFPDDGATYVPVGIGRYQVNEPFPSHFYSHAVIQPAETAKTMKGSITYFDENGRLLAALTDVTIHRLDNSLVLTSRSEWQVQLNWQPQSRPEASRTSPTAGWLIIAHEDASENPLIHEIKAAGGKVRFLKANTLTPSPAAWASIWDGSQPPQGIIYLASDGLSQTAAQDAAAIQAAQKQIVEPILGLLPHITQLAAPPRLWLVTRGAHALLGEEPVAISQRPLWGLAQTIDKEHPELRCTCIDLNAYPQVGEQEALWAEIQVES